MIGDFSDKQLIIFGLGREGVSTYHFLRQYAPTHSITLVDEKPLAELSAEWQQIATEDAHVRVTSAAQVTLDSPTLIFRSAGVPRHKVETLFPGAEITSNTQLCFDMVNDLKTQGRDILTIGITGTKGKSTTSAAIQHVLKDNGFNAFLGGNIGKPPLKVLAEALDSQLTRTDHSTILVLELSSHQLSDLTASPDIAVIQDVLPEHLDYYADFQEYWTAKSQIARHQTEKDLIFFNKQSETATKIAQLSVGTKIGFGDLTPLTELVNPADLKVVGSHNYHNLLPAILIGRQLGLTNEQLAHALTTFTPLPHRLEKVAELKGVTFINDSLATNPQATIAALEAFKGQSVILIAGGFDRGLDYTDLGPVIATHNVKSLILFKPTGEKIEAAVKQAAPTTALPIQYVTTMAEAVAQAWSVAEPGDIVLMSPASASFGVFKDYADRGEQFRNAARSLSEKS